MAIIQFIGYLTEIINRAIVPFLFTAAFLLFIWGVFRYFFASGSDAEEKRKEGRNFIMYGIIGFFLMMAIWGIVNLLLNTFGFDRQLRPDLPSFGGPGGYGNSGVSIFGGGNGVSSGGSTSAGVCGGGNLCAPWNECIGGACLPRSGPGGVGDACYPGTNACVNGAHCDQTRKCVRDTASTRSSPVSNVIWQTTSGTLPTVGENERCFNGTDITANCNAGLECNTVSFTCTPITQQTGS